MAWNNKGASLYDLGKYDEAIKACDEAIKINQTFTMAWNNKDKALNALVRTVEANTAFAKAKEPNLLDINSGAKPTTTAYQPISNQVQSGRYPANKDTKVYHEPGCTWAGKINPENLVGFSSPAEAEAAGYRHCKKC
jgi:tetratricopeptide (TPR) repeat protein